MGCTDQGKPRIENDDQHGFNLSHCGDQALFAVGLKCDVGVDLEQIRPMSDRDDIARRFFCREEHEELLALPLRNRDAAFFACWTRKEAYLKGIGAGLSVPLDSFRVPMLDDLPVQVATGEVAGWWLHDVAPRPDYAAALAVNLADATLCGWRFPNVDECVDNFSPL